MRARLHNTINDSTNKPVNRHTLLNTHARLFCRECQNIRRVIDFDEEGLEYRAQLECRHVRGIDPTEEAHVN